MPKTNVTSGEEINRCVILTRSGRFTVTELCEQLNEAARPATNIWSAAPHSVWRACSRAATDRTTRRSAPTKRSRHSFSRTRLGKENCLPTPTGSPTPRRANRSSGRSPPATDRAADTSQAAPRLATCQPKHRSLPEKILKRLLLDSERFGGQHPIIPTPRYLPTNGKQSLDSRPKSPFPSQSPFPTPRPQHYPSPPPSQNRLIYG